MSLLHMKIIKKKENKRKTRLMKNIEKYKDIVLKNLNACDIDTLLRGKMVNGYCEGFNCEGCGERVLKWLLEEAKEPVLDDVEKEYLSAVIKPFRKKVSYISKLEKGYPETDQFIKITLINDEYVCLPYFTRKSRMYIGMKPFRHYTLQELGL